MFARRSKTGQGTGQALWPILLLLLTTVLVPTACVLWFMTQAMRNERLAVRQRLTETYRVQLLQVRDAVEERWRATISEITRLSSGTGASEIFAELVRADLADGFVIRDESGAPVYPTLPGHERDLTVDSVNEEARALLEKAHEVARTGEQSSAVQILVEKLTDDRFRNARDISGRLLVPSAQLLALQWLGDPTNSIFQTTATRLLRDLEDYSLPMPASQRRFLMQQASAAIPDCPPFPTLEAEMLAAEYLEADPAAPQRARLVRTPLAGVWSLASSDGRVTALYRETGLLANVRQKDFPAPFPGVRVQVAPAESIAAGPVPFESLPASEVLPGWQVAMLASGPDPFDAAADERIAVYLWTGGLVIAAVTILALLVGGFVQHQIRLTRLKNDLIATVSHELKTPLASIRLLVDTLREGNCRDEQHAREYLELIARENERLTRLIDNFLTFSRMERNKRTFVFEDVALEDAVAAAMDSVRERFEAAGFMLRLELAEGLPAVRADRDALVTVLLNLLDNAYKYSENDKRVTVRAEAANGRVLLSVSDHGIGLSRRQVRRVFDRFYQVDQRLSRRTGGCGLGLSIVKFVVDAHGGEIRVASQPGAGSTFTVELPGATADDASGRMGPI